jgi:hypothetical protein
MPAEGCRSGGGETVGAHLETAGQLDEIMLRLVALEQRVAALEHEPSMQVAVMTPAAASREPAPPKAPAADEGTNATGVLSVFGSALLGVAGAYVLRAISGVSLLPRGVVAVIAVLYAAGWLFAAGRAAARRLSATLYAATSILILAPMLWEMTMRFQAMSASVAALLLAVYSALAVAAGFWRERSVAFSIAGAGAALTAVALCVGTHRTAPFAAILLVLIAVCDFTRVGRAAQSLRALAALCTDFVVWTLIYVYRLPAEARADYPPLRIGLVAAIVTLLFALDVVSVVRRAVRRAQPVSVIQAVQAMIAFGLLLCVVGWLIPGAGLPGDGVLCLLLGGACSVVAYGPFGLAEQRRNLQLFSVWSAVLLTGAAFVLATSRTAGLVLGLTGLAAVLLAARLRARGLQLQGVAFLVIGGFASGLLVHAFRTLAGSVPLAPSGPAVAVALCALVAYASASDEPGQPWVEQALRMTMALLAAFAITAFAVGALVAVASPRLDANVVPVALLRTLALCVVALALAWVGGRLTRVQMVRVAYMALAFTALKLLLEDMRQERMEFTAAAIFLVALTLIAVPRLARIRGADSTK